MEYMSSDRYYELTTMEDQLTKITELLKELMSYTTTADDGIDVYEIFSLYPEDLQNRVKEVISND